MEFRKRSIEPRAALVLFGQALRVPGVFQRLDQPRRGAGENAGVQAFDEAALGVVCAAAAPAFPGAAASPQPFAAKLDAVLARLQVAASGTRQTEIGPSALSKTCFIVSMRSSTRAVKRPACFGKGYGQLRAAYAVS